MDIEVKSVRVCELLILFFYDLGWNISSYIKLLKRIYSHNKWCAYYMGNKTHNFPIVRFICTNLVHMYTRSHGTVHSIDLVPCQHEPCHMYFGQTYTMHVNFTASEYFMASKTQKRLFIYLIVSLKTKMCVCVWRPENVSQLFVYVFMHNVEVVRFPGHR